MPTNIVIPEVGESIRSGVIAAWSVADGAYVQRDQTVLELETDKITMEVPAPASGVVKHAAKVGEEVAIGAVVGAIDESAKAPASSVEQPAKQAAQAEQKPEQKPDTKAQPVASAAVATSPEPTRAKGQTVLATPLAEKMAMEHGIDLAGVVGTGAGGRVREQDVLAYVQSHRNGSSSNGTAAPSSPRQVHREKMTPLRQRVASRLVEAQHTAAMLTTFNEVDMTAVMDLRKQYKDDFEKKHGVGLGFMSFFVKAVVQGLRAFPLVNGFIAQDDDGKPVIQTHDYCDIAIAVASPKGLVVPVLRNAEKMSFADIESGIKDLATKAKDGKLTIEEMTGGTFTITNGGIFGSLMSTPILNPPQSAILGMHAIKKRAVEDPGDPGAIALRPMMYLAVSYDHRIIDGAEAVRFLVTIKNCIENPERMLMDV